MAKIYKFPNRRKSRAIQAKETWGEQLIERVFESGHRFDSDEATFVRIVKSCRSPEELNSIIRMAENGLFISRNIHRKRMADFKRKIDRATTPRTKAAYQGWLTRTKKHLVLVKERMEWLKAMVASLWGK